MTPFQRYREAYADTPGWFGFESAAIWDALLSFQKASSITGNLLEIGVFRGRSAALSTLHADPAEHCFFVDKTPIAEARQLLASIRPERNVFVQGRSSQMFRHDVVKTGAASFRWIHIDGEHTGEAVINDLRLADILLSDLGVIAVDDFMLPTFPQITRAVFHVLEQHSCDLTMFLCGFNKAYLARPCSAHGYLRFIRGELMGELRARDCGNVTLCKTTLPTDMNCFGIVPRIEDSDFFGPAWDRNTIHI